MHVPTGMQIHVWLGFVGVGGGLGIVGIGKILGNGLYIGNGGGNSGNPPRGTETKTEMDI